MKIKNDPDELLVRALKKNKPGAFERLIDQYEAKIRAWVSPIMRDYPNDLEDVMQESWLMIFRKISKFNGQSIFSSWLYRVVSNVALVHLRYSRSRRVKLTKQLSDAFDVVDETPYPDYFARKIIKNSIMALPEHYKGSMIMKINRVEEEEATQQLKLTVPAYKSRVYRSRNILKYKLERYGILEAANG